MMNADKKVIMLCRDTELRSITLKIDMEKESDYKVSINDFDVRMSLDDLDWLQDAISEAKSFIGRK